jgi:hypothetical protein
MENETAPQEQTGSSGSGGNNATTIDTLDHRNGDLSSRQANRHKAMVSWRF